jgi:proteasome-associated ATPase
LSEDDDLLERLQREIAELEESLVESSRIAERYRRLSVDAPKRVATLEGRVRELKDQLATAMAQNDKLSYTLREARNQIEALRAEVLKLSHPPNAYATLVMTYEDGTADIVASGRKMRVEVAPDLEAESLRPGVEVLVNDSFNVIAAMDADPTGELVVLKRVTEDGRAVVTARADEERVAQIGWGLRDTTIRPGDLLLMDTRSGILTERLEQPEIEHLLLEEVPDISYEEIGGLESQIERIHDAVELPILHPELFAEYGLPAPKGILLYGPPGCGKTMIAKAVANSLAKKVSERTGGTGHAAKSYFINVKGPELLNKYVGETERHIRLIFQRARDVSGDGTPVIIFFDEMESLFRTRGTGISSDIESTIVPQLLAEIDGVETLRNVMVIGASNREDLIDPAILRPGRLDVKIKIERPDREAAAKIFGVYLTSALPIAAATVAEAGGGDIEKAVTALIEGAVDEMFAEDATNEFLEVTYQNGDKELMYFNDFASGAMIENVVRRAKKEAIKRELATDGAERGLLAEDLSIAIRAEFAEHEDLPNTTNPDDWAKISGKKGERIVYVRTIVRHEDGDSAEGGRTIEHVATGQYL